MPAPCTALGSPHARPTCQRQASAVSRLLQRSKCGRARRLPLFWAKKQHPVLPRSWEGGDGRGAALFARMQHDTTACKTAAPAWLELMQMLLHSLATACSGMLATLAACLPGGTA